MQVPTLLQTQDHLRQVNFKLEPCRSGEDRADGYELRDADDAVWGRFDSLVAFWAMWLGHASEILSEGRRASEFIKEFEDASEEHRSEMVAWHEGRLSNLDPEPYERWAARWPNFSPDDLPPDWREQLKANLAGWIRGRFATRCMIERMSEIDPQARARFRKLPVKIGLPELQLVD